MQNQVGLRCLPKYALLAWLWNLCSYSQHLPTFVENLGQVKTPEGTPVQAVRYSTFWRGMTMHLLNDRFVYMLFKGDTIHTGEGVDWRVRGACRVEVIFPHARTIRIQPTESEPGIEWIYGHGAPPIRLRRFRKIRYERLWDGIDLVVQGKSDGIEYDFLVEPGADIRQIRMEVRGADVSVEGQELRLRTPWGEIRESAPKAWTPTRTLPVSWLVSGQVVSFSIHGWDGREPLWIDPPLRVWGSYYGGAGGEDIMAVATDSAGFLYVVGKTSSLSAIATSGAYQTYFAGDYDAFVACFDPHGNRVWGTYFGGAGEDRAFTCSYKNGSLYVGGITFSSEGIATASAYQSAYGGGGDAFLARFDPQTGQLLWATYYGGPHRDLAYGCAADGQGHIYLAGSTYSQTGIATGGAYQSTSGGEEDAFLAKFSDAGQLLWATYYGGEGADRAYTCVPTSDGGCYLCGATGSLSRIAFGNVHQLTYGGGEWDGLIVRFGHDGTALWATYWGGGDAEWIYSASVGRNDTLYVAGSTGSCDAIATPGVHQMTFAGGACDGFLGCFTGNGARVWGTYYGGPDNDWVWGLSYDSLRRSLYVSGWTRSRSGIATSGAFQTNHGPSLYDGLLASFTPEGQRRWGTYYGGDGWTWAYGCAHSKGFIYLAGFTWSSHNLSTSTSHQGTFGGEVDGFIAKFVECPRPLDTLTISSCGAYTWPLTGEILSTSGTYLVPKQLSSSGCDASVLLSLQVVEISRTVLMDSHGLHAEQQGAQYQWFNCNTGSPVSGATQQTFAPPEAGTYAVEVIYQGCRVLSECYVWVPSALSFPSMVDAKVFVSHDRLEIEAPTDGWIELWNLAGQRVITALVQRGRWSFSTESLAAGIYQLRTCWGVRSLYLGR